MAVMLGDNIYADTTNAAVMARKYGERKGSEFWCELRKRGPVLATWDDHDFGGNDAGASDPNAGDFTARHSREAAARVLSDLRRAAGSARIGPADIDALRRDRAFCRQRLQMPPRR